ncbi:MAG: hypothetical protein IPM29_02055 [Planctomycetes bacterium]|nr:hypothetical protein [Planctomycetota bacterium]
MRLPVLTTAALATLATASLAQNSNRSFGPLDADAVTTVTGSLGVQFLNGEIYISHRGQAGGSVAPHGITVVDRQGNFVRTFAQDPLTNTSAWGVRDMDTDGTYIAGGFESGIIVFDTSGALQSTFNGQPIVNPIVSTGVVGVHRALAFDPTGNGGAGSFFVGNFGVDIEEIALDGTLLRSFANAIGTLDEWSAYGLAFMPPALSGTPEGTLWMNSSPNAGLLREYAIDRATSALVSTGRTFERQVPGSAQGGLDLVTGGQLEGRGCGWDLLGLDQATPDLVTGYVGELWTGYAQGPRMLTGKNGGPLAPRDNSVDPNFDSSWEYDIQAAPGTGHAMFFNIGPLVTRSRGPVALYKSLWEFGLLTGFTTPSGPSFDVTLSAGMPISFPMLPVVAAVAPIDMHAQSIVLDPNVPAGQCGLRLPLAVTDIASTRIETQPRWVVRTSGPNSFNAVTTEGFFQVTCNASNPNDAIAELTFDWLNSSNPAQATMVFDVDQISMADVFWNGNAALTGCAGTYRNGSDIAAGLDYAHPNNNLVSTCAVAPENAGCQATNLTTTSNYKTLTWRFTGGSFLAGVKFEVDIDTDGGAGITGDAMAGMVVTIRTVGGNVMTGEIAAAGPELGLLVFP